MTLPSNTLDSILEANPLATVYADRTGLIRYWNQVAEQIFGYTAEQALGQSLDLIIPEKLRAAHWHGFEQAMGSGVARLGGQFVRTRAQTAAGQACYVEVSFALIADDSGRVVGAAAFCRPTE
ncbi:PAS domain-containing protein [Halomonas sp. WWR20]